MDQIITRPLVDLNRSFLAFLPQTVSCLEGEVSMQSGEPTPTVLSSKVKLKRFGGLPVFLSLQVGDVQKSSGLKAALVSVLCAVGAI